MGTKTKPAAEAAEAPARPPVEERGEISLELGGMPMVMRPSYEAIVAFEIATGKGLLTLAQQAAGGQLTLPEAAQIICECVKAWGRAGGGTSASGATAHKIGALILDSEGGFLAAHAELKKMLPIAATGGYTSKGEVKPTTTTE